MGGRFVFSTYRTMLEKSGYGGETSAPSIIISTFSPIKIDLVMFSDSSLSGWGATGNSVTTKDSVWTAEEEDKHINELEVMAAFNAFRSFAPSSVGISIRMFIDNSTVVSYINRSGWTHSCFCSRVAQDIALWR